MPKLSTSKDKTRNQAKKTAKKDIQQSDMTSGVQINLAPALNLSSSKSQSRSSAKCAKTEIGKQMNLENENFGEELIASSQRLPQQDRDLSKYYRTDVNMAASGQITEVIQIEQLEIGKRESATENEKTSESTLLGKRENRQADEEFDPNVDQPESKHRKREVKSQAKKNQSSSHFVNDEVLKSKQGKRDGKTTYFPQIKKLFNENLPPDLLNQLHGLVYQASTEDYNLNSLIEKFRYDYIHQAMSNASFKIESYYMKAYEYRKSGLREFAEALSTRIIQFIAALPQEEKKTLGDKFFTDVFSAMPEKKDREWSELRPDHCVTFLRILACNDHLMSLKGSKLDWITSVFNKPEVRCIDDLMQQLLPVLDLSDQSHILSKCFNLKPKLVEAITENSQELMTIECFLAISSKANESFHFVLSIISGIKQDVNNVSKLCLWLSDQQIFDILNRIAMEDNCIQFADLQDYIPLLYEKLRNKNFKKFFDRRAAMVQSMEGLSNLFEEFKNLNECHVATGNKTRIMTVALKELKAANYGKEVKEEDFMIDDTLASIANYTEGTRIANLWDWQEVITCAIFHLQHIQLRNILVEVPTGHGKSVLICSLARAIYDKYPQQKIFITTKTSYLKHHLHMRYGEDRISATWPSASEDEKRIFFIQFEELVRLKSSILKDATVIVDEIDQSFIDLPYNVLSKDKDHRIFKYFNDELFECDQVIGFTGSLSEPAQEIITTDRKNNFATLRFPNLAKQQRQEVSQVITYKSNPGDSYSERKEKIYQDTLKNLQKGKHVIVIDDQLKDEDSFLKSKLADYQTFVFVDFSAENYQQIQLQLEQMLACDKPSIVHTDISGNRGVDFKFMSGSVHVILAFVPEHSVDITQGIGRGNRNLGDQASSTLLLDEQSKMLKFSKNPYQHLIQKEKLNKVKDQKATKLLIKLHSTTLDKASNKKALELQDQVLKSIFKDRLPFYLDYGQQDKVDPLDKMNTTQRWSSLRQIFNSAKLPQNAIDFVNKVSLQKKISPSFCGTTTQATASVKKDDENPEEEEGEEEEDDLGEKQRKTSSNEPNKK